MIHAHKASSLVLLFLLLLEDIRGYYCRLGQPSLMDLNWKDYVRPLYSEMLGLSVNSKSETHSTVKFDIALPETPQHQIAKVFVKEEERSKKLPVTPFPAMTEPTSPQIVTITSSEQEVIEAPISLKSSKHQRASVEIFKASPSCPLSVETMPATPLVNRLEMFPAESSDSVDAD